MSTEATNGGEPFDLPPPSTGKAPQPGEASMFPWKFAAITAVVAVVGIVLVLRATDILDDHMGLDDDVWSALEPEGQLAVRLVVPITLLGVILVIVGVWMAMVEWRGAFKASDGVTAKGAGVDPAALIEALGKLKGAALVLIVGGVLLLAAAWVASSAVQPAGQQLPGGRSG